MRYLFEVDDLAPFYSDTLPGNFWEQTVEICVGILTEKLNLAYVPENVI